MQGDEKSKTGGNTAAPPHVPPADGSNPAAYFTVCDRDDPLAVAFREVRMAEYRLWMDNLPAAEETIEGYCTVMAGRTRASRYTIKDGYVHALMTVAESMPRLRAVQELLGHLSIEDVRAIGNEVCLVRDPQVIAKVDEEIARFLTPTAPRQVLPSRSATRKCTRELINLYDEEIRVEDPVAEGPLPAGRYEFDDRGDGAAQVWVTLPKEDACVLDRAVRSRAAADGTDRSRAFVELLAGAVQTRVVLNLYKASDIENAPVWMPRAGWLSEAGQARWEAMVTSYRDLDAARREETAAHDPTAGLKACLEGVHATCAGPGCGTPGEFTQTEHRLPHEKGGATALDNLSRLSQHWHNLKTEGTVSYLTDPSSGVTVWVLPDGSWQVTVPRGPLSADGVRTARSVAEHRATSRAAARRRAEQARRRWRDERIAAGLPDPDGPPPF